MDNFWETDTNGSVSYRYKDEVLSRWAKWWLTAVFVVLGLLGLRLRLMVHGMEVCNLVSYKKIPSHEILIPRAFFSGLTRN